MEEVLQLQAEEVELDQYRCEDNKSTSSFAAVCPSVVDC